MGPAHGAPKASAPSLSAAPELRRVGGVGEHDGHGTRLAAVESAIVVTVVFVVAVAVGGAPRPEHAASETTRRTASSDVSARHARPRPARAVAAAGIRTRRRCDERRDKQRDERAACTHDPRAAPFRVRARYWSREDDQF